MIEISPKYAPPAVKDYVFYSNFSIGSALNDITIKSKEDVIKLASNRFKIPDEAVTVEDFKTDCTDYACYVHEFYADRVADFKIELENLFSKLLNIYDGYSN